MNALADRRFWLALHRYLGLATLVFLAMAAATGCILEFRTPLDAALNPDLYRSARPARAIDPLAAVEALAAREPRLEVTSFALHPAPGGNYPVEVAARPGGKPLGFDQLFLDGGDGRVVGERRIGPGWDRRHLMQGIYLFHYTLLGGTPGRWLMGVMALGWLIGAAIGLYLTFPTRGPFLKGWARTWVVRLGARLARLLLDLHQATGLWFLIAVLALAFTSVSLNFFDEAFTPAVQAVSPPKPSPFDPGAWPKRSPTAPEVGFRAALAAAEPRAARRLPGWRPAALWFSPRLDLYGVKFTRSGLVSYHGLGPVDYEIDGQTGRFVAEDNPYDDSGGAALTRSLYPLHTGQVAGIPGQAFVFLLGLVTLVQCLTGVYLWWKRRGPRLAARRAARLAA